MASVKFNKDSPEFTIFNEFWSLLQKYYIPDTSDEYWEAVIKDTDRFVADNPHPLTRMLSRLLITFLEKKMKGEFDNG